MSKNGETHQQQDKDPSGDGSGQATAKNGEASSSLTHRATGPRTQQGKEKSKHNALKYGIFSSVVVLKGESQADFKNLLNGLRSYLLPEGTLEEILVEKLATLFWRERRLIIADGKEAIGNRTAKTLNLKLEFVGSCQLPEWDHLLRYEATLDRAIDRTLTLFERFRRMRLGQPVPPSINLNVSSS